MAQIEYKIETRDISGFQILWNSNTETEIDMLNRLCAEGWVLVCVLYVAGVYTYYFKKEKHHEYRTY